MAAIVLMLAVLFPQSALAHSSVVESNPAQNEILEQSPKQLVIRFNENIQRAYYGITLYNSSTAEVSGIEAYVDPNDGTRLLADIKKPLTDDIYTISWKAISGDGHPVEGSIIFQVGDGAGKTFKDATAVAMSDGKPLSPMLIAARWLQYAAQAMVLGALCLTLFLLPPAQRKQATEWMREKRYVWFVLIGAVLALIGLIIQLPLRIVWTADIPFSMVGSEIGNTLRETVFGRVWVIQTVAAALVLILLCVQQMKMLQDRSRRILGIAALVWIAIGLLAKAFDGHAYAEAYAVIAVAADYIHLLSALIWSGALLAIALFLPRIVAHLEGEPRQTMYWGVVRRFSWWAIVSVAALLVTGIYGSLLYLPNWNALFTTGYGLTLLSKMLLFLIMAAFGGMNFAKGRQQKGDIGKDIIWEVMTGFVILVLAALLVHLSPYAAPIAGTGGTPKEVSAQVEQVDGYEVSLKVPPSRMGMNTFIVTLKDSEGKPVDAEQITLQLHHLDMAMAPTDLTITAADGQDGVYEIQGMISMNGNWQVDMRILTSTLDTLNTTFTLKVPGS